MNTEIKGVPFSDEYQKSLEEKFCFADVDPEYGHRLFFENSGGSLRLRKAVEAKAMLEAFPDCPERNRGRGYELSYYVAEGTKEIMEVVFGAHSGALISELSASQCMFQAVTTIMENAKWGTNAVTTLLEHPSAHDAVEYACVKTGREFRTIPANPETGGIEVEEVLKHVDKDTVLVSIMAASNISGNIMDIKEISRRVHEINPDIYVVADAVQHAPHALIDVEDWDVDVSNFAPYKFFSVRGCGYAYVSPRVATMFHPRLKCKDADIWQLGTPAPGNFAAMMEVIRYVAEIGDHFEPGLKTLRERYTAGMNRIHLQERALLYRMLEGTDEVPGLRHEERSDRGHGNSGNLPSGTGRRIHETGHHCFRTDEEQSVFRAYHKYHRRQGRGCDPGFAASLLRHEGYRRIPEDHEGYCGVRPQIEKDRKGEVMRILHHEHAYESF